MLSFALIRCAVTTIWGSRSTPHRMPDQLTLTRLCGRLIIKNVIFMYGEFFTSEEILLIEFLLESLFVYIFYIN